MIHGQMGTGTSGDVVAVWARATVTYLLVTDQLDRGSLSGWPFHSEGQALVTEVWKLSCHALLIFSACMYVSVSSLYQKQHMLIS